MIRFRDLNAERLSLDQVIVLTWVTVATPQPTGWSGCDASGTLDVGRLASPIRLLVDSHVENWVSQAGIDHTAGPLLPSTDTSFLRRRFTI